MQLHFKSISEPTQPGPKWQQLFNTYWGAYHAWLNAKGVAYLPDLRTSQAALKKYMPEMLPTYERLCALANADEVAARFLTGYQPPAYISACSQAVLLEGKVQLVRNYDYHPDLIEGTLLLSAWNGKKVMANSDCLLGAVDGMNEDGLAVSLTFGGRKVVGEGFGIPFILRYVLEFCSNVQEAVEALSRIPSHMSYNVTAIDRSGAFKTVQLAPDRLPLITDDAFITNHQGAVDWPENAAFNKTIERSEFLKNMLSKKGLVADTVVNAFLQPPLYSTRFTEGFGTLYTAVYRPVEGSVQLRWPYEAMQQTFDGFQEEYKLIRFNQPIGYAPVEPVATWEQVPVEAAESIPPPSNGKVDMPITMVQASPEKNEVRRKKLREKIIRRGQISWEILADYWANIGKEYWKKWQK